MRWVLSPGVGRWGQILPCLWGVLQKSPYTCCIVPVSSHSSGRTCGSRVYTSRIVMDHTVNGLIVGGFTSLLYITDFANFLGMDITSQYLSQLFLRTSKVYRLDTLKTGFQIDSFRIKLGTARYAMANSCSLFEHISSRRWASTLLHILTNKCLSDGISVSNSNARPPKITLHNQ